MNSCQNIAINCFDDQILQDFNSGRLTDQTLEERVAAHLSTCRLCESKLDSLRILPDDILELLRDPGMSQPSGPGLRPGGRSSSDELSTSTVSLREEVSESTAAGNTKPAKLVEELPLRIDRYFVIRRLGSGGFGQVFLAKDPEQERLVAIKIPHASYTGSQSRREQFLREARTAAALNHPHIVPVHDCRELPDGRCIVVMKYIEGRTLRNVMQSQRLSQREIAKLIATIADALDFAHERGVWHRDVKPENVLLDAEGRPYLSDFGLAIHESQQHLMEPETAGTFSYMSPEQVRGQSRHLDGRSDIWSLGVVLYEMLTRERPFRGANRMQIGNEILHRKLKPLRLSDVHISRHLERVCATCLMKEPADRFASAAELATALRRDPRRLIRAASLAISATLLAVAIAVAASRDWTDDMTERMAGSLSSPSGMTLNPLAWSTIEATDFYDLPPDTNHVVIKSTSTRSCFETHQPQSAHYQMEASGAFQDLIGSAGISLGIQSSGQTPVTYRCLIVYIVSNEYAPQGTWLRIEDCEIGLNEERHMGFRSRGSVADFKLDSQRRPSFRLSVEVDRERSVSVRYNQQVVPLNDLKLRGLKIPSRTSCGIVAKSHVVFHSLSCKEFPR